MARIAYTGTYSDGMPFGGVFDSDSAESFEGNDPNPDGYVMAEELFLTGSDTWILNQVTAGSPDRSTYEVISPDTAREWLDKNHHPEAVKRYFERSKGGRPGIGERLVTRVPARTYNQIAALSEMYAEELPETVRRLLSEALSHRETIGAPGSRDADRHP